MRVNGDFERFDSGQTERAKKLGTATLGEAMNGAQILDQRLRAVTPGLVLVGPAFPCKVAPGDNLAMHVAFHLAHPGDVLVIACDVRDSTAMWGGLATVSAQSRGLAGVIADGAVRDVREIRELDFPLWSATISPRGARKAEFGSVAQPVVCGGCVVEAGDMVVADDDGVVVIPRAQLDETLEAGERRLAKEAALHERYAAGSTIYTELGFDRVVNELGHELSV